MDKVERRQRQINFRLLSARFGRMIGKTTNGPHPKSATLWRVTVESWLRCQGLIAVRQNQKTNVSATFPKCWSHNLVGRTSNGWEQVFNVDSNGKVTITKFNTLTVTRDTNNVVVPSL